MKTLARLALVALVAHAATFLAPGAALAQDNTAVAVNKKDGKSVFKLASCTDCRTVAAAIQVVLVAGDSTTFTPENTAVAINYQCSECETLAAAYQFVYGDGQELQFTKEGKQQLHDLKKRFQDLKGRDDLTLDQLAAAIASIAAEVAAVVETETEPKKASPATAATSTTTGPPSTAAESTSTTTTPPTTTASPPTSVASTSTTARPTPSTTTAAP